MGDLPIPPLQVSWGGGVNSTAMLIGMHERGIRPDVILFADTGGEKPETYQYVKALRSWLMSVDFPPLTVVVNTSPLYATLEEECLRSGTLPSRAYGFSKCAQKWKHAPQDKWMNAWQGARFCWARGGKVTKAIGYDAGEAHRATITENEKYQFWHPLIAWGWDRDLCIAAIKRAGLPVPPKSACFYCPSSTKREVLQLARRNPELLTRALAIESRAAGKAAAGDMVHWISEAGFELQLASYKPVKGLGRHWSWGRLVAADEAQQKLFPEAPVESCMMCSDGDPEEEAA